MLKKNHKMKKTISVKEFVSEYGQSFSKHMKDKLLELGERCVLTRKENEFILDLKHVEHTKYDCIEEACQKEYAFGQFVVNEGTLYFSQSCLENDNVMQISTVNKIFDVLDSRDAYFGEDVNGRKVDDSNIDYIVDSILEVCPRVSPEHIAILSKYCTGNDMNCR